MFMYRNLLGPTRESSYLQRPVPQKQLVKNEDDSYLTRRDFTSIHHMGLNQTANGIPLYSIQDVLLETIFRIKHSRRAHGPKIMSNRRRCDVVT